MNGWNVASRYGEDRTTSWTPCRASGRARDPGPAGRPAGSSGLGVVSVSGRIRVPSPPTRTTAFIAYLDDRGARLVVNRAGSCVARLRHEDDPDHDERHPAPPQRRHRLVQHERRERPRSARSRAPRTGRRTTATPATGRTSHATAESANSDQARPTIGEVVTRARRAFGPELELAAPSDRHLVRPVFQGDLGERRRASPRHRIRAISMRRPPSCRWGRHRPSPVRIGPVGSSQLLHVDGGLDRVGLVAATSSTSGTVNE